MKKNTRIMKMVIIMMINLIIGSNVWAQTQINKPTIALLSLETEGLLQTSKILTDLCRTELYKIDKYTVMDKYDVLQAINDSNIELDLENCYGSICLSKLGAILQVDKMLSGSIIRYPNKIMIRLRVIDVRSQRVEKDEVIDYLGLDNQVDKMINMSIKKTFGMTIDESMMTSLTKENNFENTINTPGSTQLNLSGPRSGFIVFTGKEADIMRANEQEGGFDSRPIMFQFGYQFEISYLNSGNMQALFEIIPTITGVDQGRFIPSLTLLNGIRHNKNGFEFAFGPILLMSQKAEGYYVGDTWHLWEERNETPDVKRILKKRLDSRADIGIEGGLVMAIGKTFKSGELNFPVNLFSIIKKKEFQLGLSVGYNIIK